MAYLTSFTVSLERAGRDVARRVPADALRAQREAALTVGELADAPRELHAQRPALAGAERVALRDEQRGRHLDAADAQGLRGQQRQRALAAAGLDGRALDADARRVDAALDLRGDALADDAQGGGPGVGGRGDVGALDVGEHVRRVGLGAVRAGAAASEVARVVADEQPVVAVLAVDRVEARAGLERVVAEAAEERVVLVAAVEAVVAGAGVGHDGDQRAHARLDVERVVAAERVELEHLGGGDVEPERGVHAVIADLAVDDLDLGDVVGGAEVVLDAVEAVLAVHVVRAVAVVPDQRVVARAGVHDVVARVADEAVAAGAGVERVHALAALDDVARVTGGDGVGAGAGVDGHRQRHAGTP